MEVLEDLPPVALVTGAAPVALIHYDEIEEIGRIASVETRLSLAVGNGLVDGEVHLAALDGPALDLLDGVTKRREGAVFGLIHQDVAVGQVEGTALAAGFPELPHDLHGHEGLARAGGHSDEESLPILDGTLDGAVDGDLLVVARALDRSVWIPEFSVEWEEQGLGVRVVVQFLSGTPSIPESVRRGKILQCSLLAAGEVVFLYDVSVGRVGES